MISERDCLPRTIPLYFKFPENLNVIEIEGYKAYEYIKPPEVDNLIKEYSDTHDLNKYNYLCINLVGGLPFAEDLIRLQGYKGEVINIEYHENGQIVTPIPKHLRDNERLCVIDDVLDQYITGRMIQNHAPKAQLIYLTKKIGVLDDESTIKNCSWLSEVDKKCWLLGKGMNGENNGDGYPKDWGRNYRGIAVKRLPS